MKISSNDVITHITYYIKLYLKSQPFSMSMSKLSSNYFMPQVYSVLKCILSESNSTQYARLASKFGLTLTLRLAPERDELQPAAVTGAKVKRVQQRRRRRHRPMEICLQLVYDIGMYDSCIAFNQYAQGERVEARGQSSPIIRRQPRRLCTGTFCRYSCSCSGYSFYSLAFSHSLFPRFTRLFLSACIYFCCCHFLCIFCLLHTFARLLRQFSNSAYPLAWPPSRQPSACIGMHISRHCSTRRSSSQARCQLTIYQYAMRMPCDFAYLWHSSIAIASSTIATACSSVTMQRY